MSAKRCSDCSLDWPTNYSRCYQCGGHIWPDPKLTPMDEAQAATMKATYQFEAWLLTPEGEAATLAAVEANDRREAELAALDASLEAA